MEYEYMTSGRDAIAQVLLENGASMEQADLVYFVS